MSNYLDNTAEDHGYFGTAAQVGVSERVAFIRRTYAHLLGATVAFLLFLTLILQTPLGATMFSFLRQGRWAPLLLLGGFLAASTGARYMARNTSSRAIQYFGLILYTAAEAVIFSPLLWVLSQMQGGEDILIQAGTLTLLIFGGLTCLVMVTKKDFSFLGNLLWMVSLAALGLAVIGGFGGLHLGTWYVVGMIVLMSGYILYDTSNVLHYYGTDQHVAAALELFASLATLFWYVIRFVMEMQRRN